MSNRIYLFFVTALLVCAGFYSHSVAAQSSDKPIEINHIDYLNDQSFAPSDIIGRSFTSYTKPSGELFRFPFEPTSHYWVRLSHHNTSDAPRTLYLQVSYPDIHSIRFFERSENGTVVELQRQPAKSRLYSVRLDFAAGEEKHIVMKIDNVLSPTIFNLHLMPLETLYHDAFNTTLLHSLFVGAMLFAIIYFFIAFVIVRQYAYLLYTIHILSFLVFQIFVQGYPKLYLPELPYADQFKIGTALLAVCSYALFAMLFLKRTLDKVFRSAILLVCFGISVACGLFMAGVITPDFAIALGLVEYGIVFVGALKAYKVGHQHALSIVLSAMVLIVGVVAHTSAIVFQIVPIYEWTQYVLSCANFVEVVIILIMFATYFKATYEEKERALIEKFTLESSFTHRLQGQVEQKTRELQQAKSRAEALARIDDLTGLFNRRAFLEQAEYFVKDVMRHDFPLSLILVDIDHFKQINDTYGHEAGDVALTHVAKRLLSSVRDTDIVARLGGEEFIVLLPHSAADEACLIAEKIRQDIQHMIVPWRDNVLTLTSSFGVSEFLKHSDTITVMIEAADAALYKAKHNGRNRVEVSRRV